MQAESYLVYNIMAHGEIECSNTLEDALDQALPSQAFVYRPVRQRVYSLLLADGHGEAAGHGRTLTGQGRAQVHADRYTPQASSATCRGADHCWLCGQMRAAAQHSLKKEPRFCKSYIFIPSEDLRFFKVWKCCPP